jgi:ATP-binding cassette subfamily B protein
MNRVMKSPIIFGIKIAFKSTILISCLLVMHAMLIGLLPSLIVVLEANFLDKTLALLEVGFDFTKLIMPIGLLVSAIAIMWIAKSLKSVMRTLMLSSIRGYLLPQIYDKKATLAYEDYENTEICNLIQRISVEPELTVTNAFLHLLIFASDIIVVVALFCLIATYACKTAIIAFLVSLPLFLLAIKSGKANYEAAQKTTQLERESKYFDKILSDKHAVYERSLFQYGGVFTDRCFEINEVIRKILIKTRLSWFIQMKWV